WCRGRGPVIVRTGVVLDAGERGVIAAPLGDGVRRSRARGEVVGTGVLALVEDVTPAAWVIRVTSAPGSRSVAEQDVAADVCESLGTAEAVARIGCSAWRVRQLIDEGRLSGRKRGGAWFVPVSEVERFQSVRGAAAAGA